MDSMPSIPRAAQRLFGRLSRRTRICLLVVAAYALWLHVLFALGANLASGTV
jgi:hypothetical protein